MDILSLHKKHDSTLVRLKDGRLVFSVEAEKDSNPRFTEFREPRLSQVMALMDGVPDVMAFSGWSNFKADYHGITHGTRVWEEQIEGHEIQHFSSSHERSHIMCSYGLSPFPQGRPCYALVWEGTIGSFYSISKDVVIERIATPLTQPGQRFAFLFELADPKYEDDSWGAAMNVSGKLMALAGFSEEPPTAEEAEVVDRILNCDLMATRKVSFADSPLYNIGVQHPILKRTARALSDALFEIYFKAAKELVTEKRPLLISGGCGLNCEWNSRWRQSGLFDGVFVPPCTNDTGVALGTAIDAQFTFAGNAKVEWDVYAGEEFVEDIEVPEGFRAHPLDYYQVAADLEKGHVIAWVQGKCEMGPRALGNRSLLAAPFPATQKDVLNKIKQREDYRPIAPLLLEEDAGEWFEPGDPSPYMLYFTRVKKPGIEGVKHVDDSSRIQTVNQEQNPAIYKLLTAFKSRTGFGVLCNTSLNFLGKGFINRTSDLVTYVRDRELNGMVVNGTYYENLNAVHRSQELQESVATKPL